MSVKLDAFDKKILGIVLSNAKESATAIGKKIRLGRENVDYKLKRLMNQGIIREFITEFDETVLKIKHHVLFMQLIRLSGDKEKEILAYLKEHEYISWIGTAAGKWTVICDVYVPEHTTLGNIINEILSRFGSNIEEYVLLELIQGEYFFEKCIGKTVKSVQHNGAQHKKIKEDFQQKLDSVDYQILSLLNLHARITYAELSQKIHMSANGIKKRIKELEKSKVIKKYSIVLDFKKFDVEWYGIQIKTTKFDRDITKKLYIYFQDHPKVIFFYKYIGSWDYDIGFLAKNSSELRDFINELRTKFSDDLKITDIFITLEEIKGYHLPQGIFNPGLKRA